MQVMSFYQLVGGLSHPFEQKAGQIGNHFPEDRGKNEIYLKPTPSHG